MSQTAPGALTENLVHLWWQRAPATAGRVVPPLTHVLSDGLYLVAWPKWAAFGPPAALAIGILLGWWRFSPGDTFTFSLAVMALMLIISSFGAALGTWLWVGYVSADFLLFGRPTSPYETESFVDYFLHVRAPLFVAYGLLAMLLISTQAMTRSLSGRTIEQVRAPWPIKLILEMTVQGGVLSGLVLAWVWSMPILIRPIYAWQQLEPPPSAIAPLQEGGSLLVILASALGGLRVLLENAAVADPTAARRIAVLNWKHANRVLLRPTFLPALLTIPLKAGLATFLLAGILATWREATYLAATFTLILMVRQVISNYGTFWTRRVTRIPVLLRLSLCIFMSYFIARQLVDGLLRGTTYQPIVYAVVLSAIPFILLLPGRRIGMPVQEKGSTAEHPSQAADQTRNVARPRRRHAPAPAARRRVPVPSQSSATTATYVPSVVVPQSHSSTTSGSSSAKSAAPQLPIWMAPLLVDYFFPSLLPLPNYVADMQRIVSSREFLELARALGVFLWHLVEGNFIVWKAVLVYLWQYVTHWRS